MNNVDISALEQTLERYPWFSLAHLELFKKASELGEEQKLTFLNRTAAHLYSRERLFNISRDLHKPVRKETDVIPDIVVKEPIPEVERAMDNIIVEEGKPETEDKEGIEEITFEIESDPLHINELPKIFLAGGDYFSRNDFEEVTLDTSKPVDRFIIEKPSLLRSNPAIQQKEIKASEDIEEGENFDDSGFYTETLARIYTEQSFYKRAIEVYAKLILLYPEKSSYFATLVQELKSKHNQ